MPYAALEEKLRALPEECLDKVSRFLDFLQYRAEKEKTSDEKTPAAMREAEELGNEPSTKFCDSAEALSADLDAEGR